MCHILLLMPILGLPLFWILDFWVALPLYLGILVISGIVMWLTMQSMTRPASSGCEGMRGDVAEVVEALHPRGTVRYHNQFWSAQAGEPIEIGDTVRIVGNTGLCLRVERLPQGQPAAPETGLQDGLQQTLYARGDQQTGR